MPTPNRNFVLFRSKLFLDEQPDDQIGRWFLGGDCAGWIYARLLPQPNIVRESEPLMEDWGWHSSVKTEDTNLSIELFFYSWVYQDHCWLIGLAPRRQLLRRASSSSIRSAIDCVAEGIDHIISSDDRFESLGWHEQEPTETTETDPPK